MSFERTVGPNFWLFVFGAAIALAIVIHILRTTREINNKIADWQRRHLANREQAASALTTKAHSVLEEFYAGLRRLPQLLQAASQFLADADTEFQEKAYAPFWDNIEQAAMRLGAFNSELTRLETATASYRGLLMNQIHDFPPLAVQPDDVPNPAPATERLRQLVRMGQKNFEFATIWEHRKTQKVILEGFRTLGEAIGNLGMTVDESFARVTRAIDETSSSQLEEQVRLRGVFEETVDKWEEQKRLHGAR